MGPVGGPDPAVHGTGRGLGPPLSPRPVPTSPRPADAWTPLGPRGRPVPGLADVATAVHVTPRAVQYAFRRHVGTTPMRYLRRVRLARVHQDLVAAGQTVTTVRWGFVHPGRFAAYYRSRYGVAPRVTLYS